MVYRWLIYGEVAARSKVNGMRNERTERQTENELPVAGHFVGWSGESERRLTGTERSKISVYTLCAEGGLPPEIVNG